MPIHVLIRRLRGQGDGRSIVFNRSEQWVRDRIVEPWDRGEDLVVNGEHWNPRDVQVSLRETNQPINAQEASLTAWNSEANKGRDRTDDFIQRPAGNAAPADATEFADDRRKVMVVHGRDSAMRDSLFAFLRSIDLRPLEWTQLVGSASSGAPYIGQVLDAAFLQCQAVVVLSTPDDIAYLRQDLVSEGDPYGEAIPEGQARPNVFLEAGMALGRFPTRTIFVETGSMRPASDLAGRHAIRLDEGPECRRDLAKRLEDAGCEINADGTDWLSAGDFSSSFPRSIEKRQEVPPQNSVLIRRIDVLREELKGEHLATEMQVKIFNALLNEIGVDELPRAEEVSPFSSRSSTTVSDMRLILSQAKQHLLQAAPS